MMTLNEIIIIIISAPKFSLTIICNSIALVDIVAIFRHKSWDLHVL